MTLLELINIEINKTQNIKALKSLKMYALIDAKNTFKQVLNLKIINAWIKDGFLDYSRKSKNRLKEILEFLELSESDKLALIARYEQRKGKLSIKLNQINSNIDVINVTASDGIELKGTLIWWSKDYNLYLNEPFEAECGGGHLTLCVPVVYVFKDDQQREGVKCIPLLDKAKEALIEKYEKGKR